MSNTNPTIVQASLDDKELQASINKMVANFDKGLQTMLEHSNEYVGKIQASLQKIGDTNFGAKGSNDGAVVKQTKAQNDFTDAVKRSTNEIKRQGKEGEMSFDQIAAALSKARQTVSEFNTKRASGILPSSEDYKRYEQSLARIVEYNDKLKQSAISRADANQWANVFDARRNVKDLFSTDERLKQLNKYYAEQEKLSQKATQDEERQRQKRVAAMEKESAAQKKMIDDQYKLSFARTMKIPTDQLDLAQAKLERLQALLRDMRERGILSNTQIASTEAEIRKLEQIIGQVNTAQQQTTQSAQRYTEEIRKQAAAIRATKEWQEKGHVVIGDVNYYDKERANVSKRDKQLLLSLEEQIVQAQQNEAEAARRAAQETRNQAQAQQQVQQAALGTARIVESVHEMQRRSASFSKGNASIPTFTVELESAKRLSDRLKELREQYNNMNFGQRIGKEGQAVAQQIREITRQGQILNNQLNRPTKKEVFGLSEKTLDDIAYKMRQLSAYRGGLDASKQSKEITQVNDEYNRLKKRMDEVMQKNQQMIASNTALGRSWNYMKNRLAFYFTVGASTQFVKNLIEVRSQYEMNERALGILINSAERGTQIFNELSQMALVSPYTLIELSSAAKQLTAYDIAAKDVVNTTRRLADMAAAVGIPIERLTYALGQVKAYGYLNARDARMFANAGIPLVKNLSEYYTELEGRLVSTADIYDRIKKKQIGYEEVMSTISKMTDEGGKFFDFQAKMAETLKVQLANLTLAWNNMLNDMGEESQGVIVGGIGALKQMFLHWKDIEHVLYELVVALGAYKAYQIITTRLMGTTAASLDAQVLAMKRNNAAMLEKQALTRKLTVDELRQVATQNQVTAADYRNALSGKQLTKQKALLLAAIYKNNVQLKAALVNMGLLTTAEATSITRGKALAIVFKSIGISIRNAALAIKSFMMSNWLMFAIAGVYELIHAYTSANEHIEEINKQATEHAKEAFENIKQYLESESTINTRQRVVYKEGNPLTDSESQKAWDEMREKIELSSSASNTFIAKLMQIDNINNRLAAGFDYLRDVQRVAGVMQTLEEDAVNISSTTLGGLFGEGLKDDLEDFINAYQKYVSLNENLRQSGVGEEYFNEQKRALEEFRGEVEKTTTSLYNIASREGFNTNEQREFFEREISEIAQAEQMGAKETRIFRMQAEKEYYAYARAQLVAQLEYQQGAQKAATEKRIKDLDDEFGTNKSMQESFFTWLTEKQDHAVKNMLRGKTQEEIKQGEWLKGANAKWVEEMAQKFSKEYGVSFDDLHRLVLNANTWSINIPVFFQTIGQPLSDVQRDYEARTGKKFSSNPLIKDAKTQVEILDILKKKQKEVAQEMETSRKAGGQYWEDNKQRYKEENDALVADIHAYNALTDAEEKANKKSGKGGSKKDPLLDALKQEISLVEKLQGDYDKLTKSSSSQADALETIRGAYGKTIRLLNAQLGKYGLPQLDISQLITGKDPNKALAHFKQTLDTLVSKGMLTLERSKELEAVVEKFTLSAKTYNLDMITKGLNNELGKLKDEYELALELDANPELGNMFTDMFGIDTSDFPRTIDEYMSRVQQEFDDARKSLNLAAPLNIFTANTEQWYNWGKAVGYSEEQVDNFKKSFDGGVGVAKKWATDVVNNTKKLEYELAELDDKIAIKEKEQAQLHERIEKEKNEATKHYLELTYQSNEKAIDELRAQALSLMPEYARVFNSIAEYSAGVSRRLQRDLMRVFDEAKYDSANKKWTLTGSDGKQTILNDTQYRKEREKLTREMRKSQAPFKKIKEAFKPSDKNGVVDYAKGIELVSAEVQKLGSVASEVGNLAQIFGADENTVEIINDIATSLNGVATAGQGISQIASGDYIGGAASVLGGITSVVGAWFDNADKEILAKIKDSEREVKKLENSYKNLEYAIEQAYGMAEYGARRAAIANRQLQLVELQRQLRLEQSRDSKHRDEERILELKGQIIDLRNEISQSVDDITNDLLGISSIGDAAEQLVSSMIDAFRQGEDYMQQYDESFEKMIDNMIMKAIVSRVVGDRIEQMWNQVKSVSEARGAEDRKRIEELTKQLSDAQDRAATAQSQYDETQEGWWAPVVENMRKRELDSANAELERIKAELAKAEKDYAKAIEPTKEDIDSAREMAAGWREGVKNDFEYWMGVFGIGYGQDAESKQLSSLQQGIQSVTEETAGALEAYMNGVSQQVYLHSDLLTQIRDAVVGFDIDVQTASLSQILLQLQTNYIVMQSMQSMMEGWTTPSGQGIRVELIS